MFPEVVMRKKPVTAAPQLLGRLTPSPYMSCIPVHTSYIHLHTYICAYITYGLLASTFSGAPAPSPQHAQVTRYPENAADVPALGVVCTGEGKGSIPCV